MKLGFKVLLKSDQLDFREIDRLDQGHHSQRFPQN